MAISRARYEVHLYTNNAEKLPRAILRDSEKTAALDLRREAITKPVVQRPPREAEAALARAATGHPAQGVSVRKPQKEAERER